MGDVPLSNANSLTAKDRRRESRAPIDITLTLWGVDIKGERFILSARAHDISLSGALLSGLDADLRPGDVVGVLYGNRKARFRVVWTHYDGTGDKMQVALHRIEPDECPWQEMLRDASPIRDTSEVQPVDAVDP